MNIDKNQATTQKHTLRYPIVENDSALFSNDFSDAENINPEILKLLTTDSEKALELLLTLTKKHPDEPMLAYHLVDAYRRTNNNDLANQIIRNNYRRFPHFLMIRCDYVQLCLEEDKIMEAAAALDYKFDLMTLYPKKSDFHTAEVITFQSILVRYFCKMKDFNRAVIAFSELKAVNANLPPIKILQNFIVMSIMENNISYESLGLLFDFDEEEKNK